MADPVAHIETAQDLRDRYLQAQLVGDRREAVRLLLDEGIGAGLAADDIREVVRGAQEQIGDLWQANEISVAQEHMATAISQLVLSHLYERQSAAASNGRSVIVACVEGEQHEFPARLAADALDLAGYEVRYLGADVPTESAVEMVSREEPDAVVLSFTLAAHLEAAVEAVSGARRVGEAFARRPFVAVGGGGVIDDEIHQRLVAAGADLVGGSAAQLVTAADRSLGAFEEEDAGP